MYVGSKRKRMQASCRFAADNNDRVKLFRLVVEADRLNLEVAKRTMEEEARLAKREADLLTAASTVLVRGRV